MIHILAQFSVKEDKISEFIELCEKDPTIETFNSLI